MSAARGPRKLKSRFRARANQAVDRWVKEKRTFLPLSFKSTEDAQLLMFEGDRQVELISMHRDTLDRLCRWLNDLQALLQALVEDRQVRGKGRPLKAASMKALEIISTEVRKGRGWQKRINAVIEKEGLDPLPPQTLSDLARRAKSKNNSGS